MNDVPQCQCTEAGWCPTLNRNMPGRLHHLCQTSEKYRCKWFKVDCGATAPKSKCCKKVKKPSRLRQAVTFGTTLAKWAASGFTIASGQEQAERLALCSACPLFDGSDCLACGCNVQSKVKLGVSYCPAGKWFVERPKREVVGPRNLMMHILPVAGNGVWQWNVAQLLRRMDLFDGKRVVAIITPQPGCKFSLNTVEEVQAVFAGHRIDEWIIRKNKPSLRETVTWPLLLDALKNEPGITFACHAKGVTHDLQSITNRWTKVMWETCLDDFPSVDRALSMYSMAGSFKRYGQFRTPQNHRWHYSGTFYWFRNDDVFSRDWRILDQTFFGNESWPGRLFPPEETACLFMDDTPDPYSAAQWETRIEPAYQTWVAARQESESK